ncbi:NADH:flavin oxidoreductase/NADH oxidase family protein [Oleomonas cavernae]|uniref:NADH:flavin oxidoreductase/NADH oxidase family protein n=1 Tax=Oleomonas cavernae TaxID=2320859 RepID=A0A418WEW0_9PROT|nr:NADH:flavin oxidoreductase/NADH oxidase family protein [Oleomonas cavernae]RJF88536.1 NADH:flavin oxidoreductase/NADH oxidase family protein [Oleomonas cavernae]
MTTITTPLTLPCGTVLPNRLCKAAMTEGLADEWNRANRRHEILYRRWSEGGAGLLLTGNVTVDRRHPERPGNVAIDGNGGLEQLAAYARAGKAAGNHIWIQLTHGGRQTPQLVNERPLAPSAIRLRIPEIPGFGYGQPVAMTEAQILDVVARFARAAMVARDAGFTGVQIHAAHGYLISSFLNPLANQRQDAWGGSLRNRARLLLEVITAVRQAVGADFPVAVKLNSSDFQKGGFTTAECLELVGWLNETGIDLLEISGGSHEQPKMVGLTFQEEEAPPVKESTLKREAYFLEYAAQVRPVARMPLMVTGGFRTLAVMNAVIEAGELDVVGIGRPLVVDPSIAGRLLAGTAQSAYAMEDRIHNVAAMPWFYMQLRRLGDGLDPDLSPAGLETAGPHAAAEAATAAALRWEMPAA